MNILVTGANGYLGQGIVKQLLDDGNHVVATDFMLDRVDQRAEKKECDIFSISNPYSYFGKPDVLLHMAWRNGFVHNAISHIDDLPYHYKFLKEFSDSDLKQIAVMGTMHEVGFYEGSIKEDTPTKPQSLYGIAKDALRNALFVMTKDKPICVQWLRGFYIVGTMTGGSSIFSKIAAAEEAGKNTFPFTTGQNQWDFLDYEEFCEQVAKTVEQKNIDGIINICSGRPEKLADRVERFIEKNGYHIQLEYGTFPDRDYDSKAVWGDDTKIIKIMNSFK